ncbi:hypothetical protein ACOSQ3_027018 [Xanthoceras sorbifolium]
MSPPLFETPPPKDMTAPPTEDHRHPTSENHATISPLPSQYLPSIIPELYSALTSFIAETENRIIERQMQNFTLIKGEMEKMIKNEANRTKKKKDYQNLQQNEDESKRNEKDVPSLEMKQYELTQAAVGKTQQAAMDNTEALQNKHNVPMDTDDIVQAEVIYMLCLSITFYSCTKLIILFKSIKEIEAFQTQHDMLKDTEDIVQAEVTDARSVVALKKAYPNVVYKDDEHA